MRSLVFEIEIFNKGSYYIKANRQLDIHNSKDTEEFRRVIDKKWWQYELEKEKNGKK